MFGKRKCRKEKFYEKIEESWYNSFIYSHFMHRGAYMYLSIPTHEQVVTQGLFFIQSLSGLNLEFFFSNTSCHIKVKESSLPNYFT